MSDEFDYHIHKLRGREAASNETFFRGFLQHCWDAENEMRMRVQYIQKWKTIQQDVREMDFNLREQNDENK